MRYEFPRIVHIQQVLDAIVGDEDLFYITEKEGYTVVNYKLPCNKTFPAVTDRNTAIRRELRGIKFDSATGETIARPYPKFFNAGEREETLLENIDISQHYERLEKLDGSMVHPLLLGGGIRWSTKAGVTETSMQTESWLAAEPNEGLENFIDDVFINDYFTPIFEWCSRKNRIVIDHPIDRLVLTGIRGLYSGHMIPYQEMDYMARQYNIEVVELDETPISDMKNYVNGIHNLQEDEITEGEVLRFETGHMVKVKTLDYVNLHKTKDKIQKERNFVAVLLSGNLDDLKPFMLAEDLAKAEVYEAQLNQNVISICNDTLSVIHKILNENMSRKDFALTSNVAPLVKQIVFQQWDKGFANHENVVSEEIMKKLRDACEHEQKFERLKPELLKGCEW